MRHKSNQNKICKTKIKEKNGPFSMDKDRKKEVIELFITFIYIFTKRDKKKGNILNKT